MPTEQLKNADRNLGFTTNAEEEIIGALRLAGLPQLAQYIEDLLERPDSDEEYDLREAISDKEALLVDAEQEIEELKGQIKEFEANAYPDQIANLEAEIKALKEANAVMVEATSHRARERLGRTLDRDLEDLYNPTTFKHYHPVTELEWEKVQHIKGLKRSKLKRADLCRSWSGEVKPFEGAKP